MLIESNATLDDFIYHKEEKYLLVNYKQNGEDNQKNLITKNFKNKTLKNMLSKRTFQDKLRATKLLSFIREQEFGK